MTVTNEASFIDMIERIEFKVTMKSGKTYEFEIVDINPREPVELDMDFHHVDRVDPMMMSSFKRIVPTGRKGLKLIVPDAFINTVIKLPPKKENRVSDYKIVGALSEDLLTIERTDYFNGTNTAPWAKSKVRKPKDCAATGAPITVGEWAFRPIGNQSYRYERLSLAAVADMIDEYRQEG